LNEKAATNLTNRENGVGFPLASKSFELKDRDGQCGFEVFDLVTSSDVHIN